MRSTIVLILSSFLFLVGCGNDSVSDNNSVDENLEEVTYCDCRDLQFDQPYNNFYLEEPREGFTGLCENLYANGKVSLSKEFKKGKVHGDVITYYENGQINEKKSFDMNFQVGNHYKYDTEGNLISQWRYERGQLVETIYPKALPE